MEPIRTGNTRERLIRNGLITFMVVGFAGWCFYDWLVRYPRQNLEQAVQVLPPEDQDSITINPKVRQSDFPDLKEGDNVTALEEMWGEPQWRQREDHGIIESLWFGPAVTVTVRHSASGRIIGQVDLQPGRHTEVDMMLQPLMGFVLGGIGVVLLIRYIYMLVSGVELSDAGLKMTGKPRISFDAMTGWDTRDYRDKGRITLSYDLDGRSGQVVLDDYKHRAFEPIVSELCRRKGYDNPIGKDADAGASSEQASAGS